MPCSTNVLAAYPAAFPPPTITYLQSGDPLADSLAFHLLYTARPFHSFGPKAANFVQHENNTEWIREEQGTHSRFWLSKPSAAAETEKLRREES